MGGLLAAIIPLGLIGAIVPTRIMVGILLLTSQKPLRNTPAYLAGLSCLYLAVVFLALFVIGSAQGIHHETDNRGPVVMATLQVIVGALFILVGSRLWPVLIPMPHPPPGRSASPPFRRARRLP
jgi:hypothetical protein